MKSKSSNLLRATVATKSTEGGISMQK